MQKLKDLYQTDQGVHCQFSSLANVVNYYNPNIKSSNLFFNGGYFKTHYRFEEGQGLSDIRLTNEFGKIYKKYLPFLLNTPLYNVFLLSKIVFLYLHFCIIFSFVFPSFFLIIL